MVETSDFRKGLKILVEGSPYEITDFQHVKPGKGNQFSRTKLRNLLTGTNLERTFKSGERFEVPDMMNKEMNFLYKDEMYHFMDQSSFEQYSLTLKDVGHSANFLIENLPCVVLFYNNKPIAVDLPNTVNLKVLQTDPGFKGNTVTGTTKPATIETGYIVQVPLHVLTDDLIKIDTRTGEYVTRVNG